MPYVEANNDSSFIIHHSSFIIASLWWPFKPKSKI